MMKYTFLLFCIVLFSSCKTQKFQLEDSPELTLKEGYYVEVPPAIFEGNAYVKATLKFHEFDKSQVELIGFYFRNNFIKMKEVSDPFAIEGSVLKVENDDDVNKTKIPFNLQPFEVVLSYKSKGKQKYAKYKVNRKEVFDNIPR